jgi:hypothetical protein
VNYPRNYGRGSARNASGQTIKVRWVNGFVTVSGTSLFALAARPKLLDISFDSANRPVIAYQIKNGQSFIWFYNESLTAYSTLLIGTVDWISCCSDAELLGGNVICAYLVSGRPCYRLLRDNFEDHFEIPDFFLQNILELGVGTQTSSINVVGKPFPANIKNHILKDVSNHIQSSIITSGVLDDLPALPTIDNYRTHIAITLAILSYVPAIPPEFLLFTQGADDNTSFSDSSPNTLTVLTRGDIHTVNPSPALGSSAYFGGTGDGKFLEVAANPLLNGFGFGDFNISAFIYCEDVNAERSIISCKQSSLTGAWDSQLVYNFAIIPNGKLAFYAGEGAAITIESASGVIPNNTLVWVEASRIEGVTRLFAQGVLLGAFTETSPISISRPAAQTYIGAWAHYDNQSPFKGYIPELYIYNGIGGNTANYDPPIGLTPGIPTPTGTSVPVWWSKVALALKFESYNGSITITDHGPHNKSPTTIANASITTADSKFGASSLTSGGGVDSTRARLEYASSRTFALGKPWSLCFYIKIPETGPSVEYFMQRHGASGQGGFFFERHSTFARIEVGNFGVVSGAARDIPYNQWVFITATDDPATFTTYLGANGVVSSNSGFTSWSEGVASFGVVNGPDLTYSNSFSGLLDEVIFINGYSVLEWRANFTPPTVSPIP